MSSEKVGPPLKSKFNFILIGGGIIFTVLLILLVART